MDKQEVLYKNYKIMIHPQQKKGDYVDVFFRIFKNDESIFTVWIKISGTSISKVGYNQIQIFNILSNDGLSKIKNLIDTTGFIKNKEYQFIVGN